MATLEVEIPESLEEFVQFQTRAGGYGTACEYVRSLIREDQKRAAIQSLERELLKGLNSGSPIEVTPQFWSDLKADLKKRHAKRKANRRKPAAARR